MHANLPVIANRWEKKYGLGGVAELNAELNSLPEYYLPQDRPNVAQGGLIPAHQAGIYGLAEGGRIGFKTRGFVQPRSDGQRPGYTEDEEDTGDVATESASDVSYGSSDDDHGAGDPNQFDMTPPSKPDVSVDPDQEAEDKALSYVNWNVKEQYPPGSDIEEQREIDKRNAITKLRHDPNLSNDERRQLEVGLGLRKATPKPSMLKTIGGGLLTLASLGVLGPAAAKMASYYKTGKTMHGFATTGKGKIGMFDVDFKNKTVGTLGKNVNLSNLINTKTGSTIDKDPSGLGYGKDLVKKPIIDHGDNGQTNGTITESLKTKQMEEASRLAVIRQKELRDKQMAYWREMMKPYMSAKGGRVPGYNTGGLSNLFRLKTA